MIKKSKIILILGLIVVTGFVVSQTVLSGESDNVRSWLWNAQLDDNQPSQPALGLGWGSLNCVSDFDFDGDQDFRCFNQNSTADYGLTVSVNNLTTNFDSDPNFIKGCAWTDTFGYICFNRDANDCPGSSQSPPNADVAAACDSLAVTGVALTEIATNVYLAQFDDAATSSRRSVVLSLAENGAVERGYISFPFDAGLAATPASLGLSGNIGSCTNCDPTTNSCAACYPVGDPDSLDNANYLCTQCSSCTLSGTADLPGGSCSTGHNNDYTCDVTSCTTCYPQGGLLVNYPRTCEIGGGYCNESSDCSGDTNECNFVNSRPELCGWGYNAWDPGTGATDAWAKTGWSYRVKITVNGAAVVDNEAGDLTNFPVYVDLLNQMPAGFLANAKSDGSDIVVTTKTGTELNREVVLGPSGNYQELFFNVPTLTDTDTEFYIYYGNSSATETNDIATWNDYEAVFHFNEDPSSTIIDSSVGNDATQNGTMTSSNLTTGFNGNGSSYSFDGVDDRIRPASLGYLSNFTISGWGYYSSDCTLNSGGNCGFWQGANGANRIFLRATGAYIEINDVILQPSGTPSNTNTWRYFTIVKSGDTFYYYQDDQFIQSKTDALIDNGISFAGMSFGWADTTSGSYWDGKLDEMRISSVARSTDWIATEYANQNSPATFFKSIGTPETESSSSGVTGLGWIAFNPILVGSATPYTEAQRGNIYSEKNITATLQPPLGKYNAAYLIDAGGTIFNWVTNLEDGQRSSTPGITFPDYVGSNAYSSLGYLDLDGLVTDVTGGSNINKYGASINDTAGVVNNTFNSAFDDTVYVFSGDQTVSGGLKTIAAGSGTTSGAGIIFIDGDLTIQSDIEYDTFSISTRIKHIPSLVWIVKGDVTIAETVTEVAGTFIVLGAEGAGNCPDISQTSNNCGRFSTGDDSAVPVGLDINGNVIARQIHLQRSYGANDEAAERFIADGRLQANTPPGLSDISSSLPRFSLSY